MRITERLKDDEGKSGGNTYGTFGPGNPGKPKGTHYKATQAALALPDGEADALTLQSPNNRRKGGIGCGE